MSTDSRRAAALVECGKDWLKYAVLALLGVHVLLALGQCVYPYDNDQSYMTFGVSRELVSGEDPWLERHALEAPYVIPAYGPVLHALGAIGWALFGRQFWVLRVASLLGFLGCLLALIRIARGRSRANGAGLLSALVFVSFSPIVVSSASGRGDMVALGCATLGVSVLLDAPVEGIAGFVVAGLLCGFAPLVKQLYVGSIAVGTLFCLMRRSRRQALAFLSSAVVPPLTCFILLNWISGGGFWRMVVVYPSRSSKSLGHLVGLLLKLAHDPVWDISLLVLAWAWIAVRRRRRATRLPEDDALLLLEIWLPLALIQSLLMGTRNTANGYWLELWFVVSAMLPRVLALLTPAPSRLARWVQCVFPVVLVAGAVAHFRALHGLYFEWKAGPYYESLVDLVRERSPAADPCLTEYSDVPERAGREVLFNDYLLYGVSTAQNRALVQGALNGGRFGVLLLQPKSADLYVTDRYARIETRVPFPTRVWAVAPYLRKDLLTAADVLVPTPAGQASP